MHIHIKIQGAQLGAFFRVGAPQLIDDGLFAVHHLVVAQRQQIQLVVEVMHAENDLAVGIRTLTEGGGKIVQCVVHPAHVPLVVEAHAVVAGGSCHLEEVGGVLCHVDAGGPALVQAVVQAAQKVHRALIYAAVGVALPVQRPGDGVHADAVTVVHVHPQPGGAAQKAAHLPAVVVEVAGAPLALSHVAVVLVQVGAVKLCQCVGVGGKVHRHKVHDDADAHAVAGVDKARKLGGGAVAAGHREVAGGLVAPAAVKGVLCQRQQLHMGKVVLQQPRDQLPRQLLVVVPPVRAVRPGGAGLVLPAAGVQLVDVQRAVAAFVPPLHPRGVVKGEIQFRQFAGGAGAQLGGKGVGVAAHHSAAVRAMHAVFVQISFRKAGDKSAPHAGIGFFHGHAALPAVKAAAHLHGGGTGCPHGKTPALGAVRVGAGVRTQNAVGIEAVATEKRAGDHRVIHAKISLLLYVDRRCAPVDTRLFGQTIQEKRLFTGTVADNLSES